MKVDEKIEARTDRISVVIPTLDRGDVLIDTIQNLLPQLTATDEIVVIDQSTHYSAPALSALEKFHQDDSINWIRQTQKSVVVAMNNGLKNAKSDHVLFLDDDITPFVDLVEQHRRFAAEHNCALVAGRVVESWDDPAGVECLPGSKHTFNSLNDRPVDYFMGGNFLVQKSVALSLGGFDENFKGTAHDYEKEFADRITLAGHTILYCGKAAIHHLKVDSGGIRTHGHYLKTAKPHHAVGAYYYLLTSKRVRHKIKHIAKRLKQRLVTRTHLKQPWWIPITLIGDILGLLWAVCLRLKGPDLLNRSRS